MYRSFFTESKPIELTDVAVEVEPSEGHLPMAVRTKSVLGESTVGATSL